MMVDARYPWLAASDTCSTCGGTGRYLWTRPGAGGEVVDRYGPCPACRLPVAINLGHGYHAVIERRPTGFGPTVLVGEVRDSDDRPVRGLVVDVGMQRTSGPKYGYPVSVAPDTEEGAAELLAALTARAERLARTAAA